MNMREGTMEAEGSAMQEVASLWMVGKAVVSATRKRRATAAESVNGPWTSTAILSMKVEVMSART
jgi:hypothetical protein